MRMAVGLDAKMRGDVAGPAIKRVFIQVILSVFDKTLEEDL